MPTRYYCHECDEVYNHPTNDLGLLNNHYRSQHPEIYNKLQIFVMYDEEGDQHDETEARQHKIEIWYNGRPQVLVHDSDGDWHEYNGEEEDWVEWEGRFLFGGRVLHLRYRVCKDCGNVEAVKVMRASYEDGHTHAYSMATWSHPIAVEIHPAPGPLQERYDEHDVHWERESRPHEKHQGLDGSWERELVPVSERGRVSG